LLYECLTGRPQFAGLQHVVLLSVLSDEPVTPRRQAACSRQSANPTGYARPAIERSQQHLPDVVLLDIVLPDMDGYEVARRLRQLPGMADALLVAITGYRTQADLERSQAAGIDRHFLKPMDPRELQQLLVRAEQLGRQKRQAPC
jgi:CheY-like chemotaxis protein